MSTPPPFVPPTWPATVFHITSVIILPLYFYVLISLLHLRCVSKIYNTTFYTILLQHCIADMLTMMFFFVINVARGITFVREFYYEYQEFYIAAAAYNHIYFTLYIRCTGIVILSFHRYLMIVHHHSKITTKVKNAQKIYIIAVYWTLPTLISLVVLKDTNFYYDSLKTMSVIAEQSVIQRNTLMALIVVSLTCILCSILYGAIFIFVRKNTARLSKSVRREIALSVQVFMLLTAFFAILVYYSFQNYYAQTQNTGPIFYMRSIHQLANGFLSYINPVGILLLNKEFTKKIFPFMISSRVERNRLMSGTLSGSAKQLRRNRRSNATI